MTSSGSSLMNMSRNEYSDPDLVLTDAVALQRSVISDHDITVPASADVVAKIVAHYTSKARARYASDDTFAITHIPPILIGSDDPDDANLPVTSSQRSPHVIDSKPSLLDDINYDDSLLVHHHHAPGSPIEPFVTPVRSEDIESLPEANHAYKLLLRNYARLQGHTETLAEEAAEATRDRARLQAEVAALCAQLENARCNRSLENSIRDTVAKVEVSEAGTVTEVGLWPGQPLLLSSDSRQRLVDDTDQHETEVIRLKAELAQALAHAEQQREAATCASAEAAVSAERAAATQAALMAARGEVMQMGEAAHRLEELVQRAEEEIVAVASARDWYKEQLRTMQEARSILQEELTDSRTLLAKQANELERQRAEASQARHELSLTQQRALAEKRLLARQLELIEADMLEREASAAASDHGGGTAVAAVHKAELLALQQQLLVSSSQTPEALIELQDEVQRWRHAAETARAEADALDAQRAEQAKQVDELRQKLTLLQHETETMQERLAEADSRLKSATKKNVHLEASVLKARQEKSNVEVALQLALDEKVAFSLALDALKANAAKVEANFKQIRQELIAKQQQCEELQTERAELLRQLNNAAANGMQPTLQQLDLPSNATLGPVVISATEAAPVNVHLLSTRDLADVSRPQEPHENDMESYASARQPPHLHVEALDARSGCERCRQTPTGDQQLTSKHFEELVTLRHSLEVATSQLQQAVHDRASLEQRCRSAESATAEWRMRADRLAEVARAAEADLRLLSSAKTDLESRLANLLTRSEDSSSSRGSTSTGSSLRIGAAGLASKSDNQRRSAPPSDGVRLLETMDASASSLHGRIAALQQQLDVHSSAVRSSSENWRTIEEELRELQQIVHGDHAITAFHEN